MAIQTIYRNERFLLEVRDGAPYLTAGGCEYALFCHPYEPCTYVKSAAGTVAVHNAFEVSSALVLFARGETIRVITGKDYDAAAFCELLAYAAALGVDTDIGYVEGALAVEKLIALGATAPETAVRVQAVGVRHISDAFSRSKKLQKRVLYTDDGRAYVRIKQ